MAAITWIPADDFGELEVLQVAIGAEGRLLTFAPGIVQDVPQDEIAPATVQAAIQAVHGDMTTPAAPAVITVGTAGATAYDYEVVAVGQTGDTLPSTATAIATGNAALSGANYNQITRAALPAHATGWRVLRTVGGATQGDISGVLPAAQTVLDDTGLPAVAYVPVGANPPVDLVLVGSPSEV